MKLFKEVPYRDKKINVYDCDVNTHFISHMISSEGFWDKEIIQYIIENVSDRSKSMIDIGGEIGSYTIALCDYFHSIITFEPNEENYEILKSNLELNGIKNVNLINSACGSSHDNCTMVAAYENVVKVGEGNIPVVPLDSLVIDLCKFIKIDVEGHELEVLKGGIKFIDKHKPVIYLETHPTLKDNVITDCENLLSNLGYVEKYKISDIEKFWEFKV